MRILFATLLTIVAAKPTPQLAADEGFVSLFNGKDLTGWEYGPVPVAKIPIIEKLDGKTADKDGVFQVRDGVISR